MDKARGTGLQGLTKLGAVGKIPYQLVTHGALLPETVQRCRFSP